MKSRKAKTWAIIIAILLLVFGAGTIIATPAANAEPTPVSTPSAEPTGSPSGETEEGPFLVAERRLPSGHTYQVLCTDRFTASGTTEYAYNGDKLYVQAGNIVAVVGDGCQAAEGPDGS